MTNRGELLRYPDGTISVVGIDGELIVHRARPLQALNHLYETYGTNLHPDVVQFCLDRDSVTELRRLL